MVAEKSSFFTDHPGFEPFRTFKMLNDASYIEAVFNGPLYGQVSVAGAKNMVTKVIAASLSGEMGMVKINNVPFIGELAITLALCRRLGVKFRVNPDKSLDLQVDGFDNPNVKFDSHLGNRTSILLAGPVLDKLGEANIGKPKGCEIGNRKINFHIEGLRAFGVEVVEHKDFLALKLKKKRFKPAEIKLPFPSVGATENLIIIASLAEGISTIKNAAMEPEILEMVKILQQSGVSITLDSSGTFKIKGGPHKMVDTINIIPDRVEAFSWAVMALSTKGDIFVKGARQDHLLTALGLLIEMGAGVEVKPDGIRFYYKGKIKPFNIETRVYPGFVTDFQQPLAILFSQCQGQSQIHETIFENRFMYLERIKKLLSSGGIKVGVNCPIGSSCRFKGKNYPHLAIIDGPLKFAKGETQIDDLRAGFALLNMGILSQKVRIRGVKLLYRGYENPVEKLRSVGANIKLVI
ncbi:UDP-N-acetylglucosamine 1-carboxyvinyltransferase [Patescibacteria group bacterium]|nr:UDP-N-acetylglucosamine 1-carboxyvinyltransferase [Patescibacteria group bacterium]